MAVTDRTYQKASLEAFTKDIRDVWGRYMMERPALYTWLHLVEHASTACEGVRRRRWDIVLDELASVIVWWLAFIAKLNDLMKANSDEVIFGIPYSPSEVIWSKFPNVCPVEFGLNTIQKHPQGLEEVSSPELAALWDTLNGHFCRCLSRKDEVESRAEQDKRFAKKQLWVFAEKFSSKRPRSLAGFDNMLQKLFSPAVSVLSVEEVAFHFLEEVGEVSRAMVNASTSKARVKHAWESDEFKAERLAVARGIVEELADVFSWTSTLVCRVRREFSGFEKYFEARGRPSSGGKREDDVMKFLRDRLGPSAARVNLADIVWARYGIDNELRCHVCRLRICECDENKVIRLHGPKFDANAINHVKAALAPQRPAVRA